MAMATSTMLYDKFLCQNYLTFDCSAQANCRLPSGRGVRLELGSQTSSKLCDCVREPPTYLAVVAAAINQHFMQSCAQLSKSWNASKGCPSAFYSIRNRRHENFQLKLQFMLIRRLASKYFSFHFASKHLLYDVMLYLLLLDNISPDLSIDFKKREDQLHNVNEIWQGRVLQSGATDCRILVHNENLFYWI